MIKVKKHHIDKQLLKKIPSKAGVYLFWDGEGIVHYVGKAKILKNRVSSYFGAQLLPKTKIMVNSSKGLSFIPTDNEFEALLLESLLVKKYQPKYNIELKDDKSKLYIVITQETYPRVLTIRKTEIEKTPHRYLYGPFPRSSEVKSVLTRIRQAFPFATHKPNSRACLESQIGLCVPCPSVIQNNTNPKQQKELLTSYRKNIRNTQKILAGQVNVVKKNLEKEMQTLSNQEEYREANLIKRQIEQINYITQPRSDVWEYHQNPNFLTDRRGQEEQALKQLLTPYFKFTSLKRIECFDVAHLAGTAPTASMVTFEAGEPNKKFYRHFKIQTQLKGDTDRIFEVIKRRIKHFTDWGKPNLLVIDGGKPQVSAAQKALAEAGIGIPVIGLAKREETIVIKKKEGFVLVKPQKQALFLLQRLRDEAHRFARRYHHKLISAIFKG